MTTGGWVDTHHFETTVEQKVLEMSLENLPDPDEEGKDEDDDEDQVPIDMDDFEASGLLDAADEDNVLKPSAQASSQDAAGEIIQTRTYDLHITYDHYYATPRLFLFGYNEVRWKRSRSLCYSFSHHYRLAISSHIVETYRNVRC